MNEVASPKGTNAECLWAHYGYDYAHEVRCTSLATFYALLTSQRTEFITASCLSSSAYFVDCHVFGPICDDANYTSEPHARLRASYRLTKANIHDPIIGLSDEELGRVVEIARTKGKNLNMKLFCAALGLFRVK